MAQTTLLIDGALLIHLTSGRFEVEEHPLPPDAVVTGVEWRDGHLVVLRIANVPDGSPDPWPAPVIRRLASPEA